MDEVKTHAASLIGATLLAAILAAALVAPPVRAGVSGSVTLAQLALMPLPASALGSQVVGLPLAHDSGVVSNAAAAQSTNAPTTAAQLAALGRTTGYQLDFGGDTPTGAGLSEIESAVELYRSDAAAGRGLAFWRKDDSDTAAIVAIGAVVSVRAFAAPGLGTQSYGVLGTVTLKGAPTFRGADVVFRSGRLVGMVSVAGGALGRLRGLALRDAGALRRRIAAVTAGRLTGRPTPLPAKLTAGPPPHGPDLEALTLAPADFVVAHVTGQGYAIDTDLEPISEYRRSLAPAGAFASLQEQVALFKDPIQATFEMAALRAALTTSGGLRKDDFNAPGKPSYSPRNVPVDVGSASFASVGLYQPPSGRSLYLGYVVVRTGSILEIDIIASPSGSPIPDAALAELAEATVLRATRSAAEPPVA